jgi:hypothetical protein
MKTYGPCHSEKPEAVPSMRRNLVIPLSLEARSPASFTLSSFAALRTVRSGRVNGLGMTEFEQVVQQAATTRKPALCSLLAKRFS